MQRIMKILIAYDGSECADEAISNLRRAGLPRVADALIVKVEEVWLTVPAVQELAHSMPAPAESGQVIPFRTRLNPRLDEDNFKTQSVAEKLQSSFPEWDISIRYSHGSPAEVIRQIANEWEADLIVAGSQGQRSNSHFTLGSVSQKLANEASCNVRVIRNHGSWKEGAPARIVIGFDGTPAAQSAVSEVAERLWPVGSEVRLLTVLDRDIEASPLSLGSSGNHGEDSGVHSPWVDDLVSQARKKLSLTELKVSEMIETGDPKEIIIREAEEWGADNIFLGAGVNGNYSQYSLLGGVSTAVLARAHCTVEIVRKPR